MLPDPIRCIHAVLPQALVTLPRTRASPCVSVAVRLPSRQHILFQRTSTSLRGYQWRAAHCTDCASTHGERLHEACSIIASRVLQEASGRGVVLRREKALPCRSDRKGRDPSSGGLPAMPAVVMMSPVPIVGTVISPDEDRCSPIHD